MKSDSSDSDFSEYIPSQISFMSQKSSVDIENLNKDIENKQREIEKIQSSQLFVNVNKLTFFQGNDFYDRKNALSFIEENFGNEKKLIHDSNFCRGSFVINLKCPFPNCEFRIACKRGRNTPFRFVEESSFLVHGIFQDKNMIGLCDNRTRPTTVLKNSQSHQKNSRKNRISTEAMKKVLAVTNDSMIFSDITDDRVKKANKEVQISAYEHFMGFKKLNAYLEAYSKLNPGFEYKIEKDEENRFERLAILFPYSAISQKYCFKVYGVDAAHLGDFEIKGKEQMKKLKEFVAFFVNDTKPRVTFRKSFLFAVTGRTINNEMILFAASIGYSENMEEYDFLFQFLNDNGFNMNQPDVTILSDRGSAILPSLNRFYHLAFLKPCAQHLKRNLITNGFKTIKLQNLYWRATNACTRIEYEKVMEEMKMTGNGKGLEMFHYLEGISNWQLFKAIERGNTVYEMSSDNIVEILFAWLLEVRSYSTPFYVLSYLIMENMNRINCLYKESTRVSILGLTTRAEDLYNTNNLSANLNKYEAIVTDLYQLAGYVFSLAANKLRTKKFNVNLTARTCDCNHYQQSGCPCDHAITLCRVLEIPVRKEFFYNFCFIDGLRMMFEECRIISDDVNIPYINLFSTVIPTEAHLDDMIHNYPDLTNLKPFLLVIEKLDKSLASAKRIRSSGESRKVKGVKHTIKMQKCKYCGKLLSKNTHNHRSSACIKYLKKINGNLPLITPIV